MVAQKSYILWWCLGACTPTPTAVPWKGPIPLLRALFHTLLSQRTLSGSLWVSKLSVLGARQAVKELLRPTSAKLPAQLLSICVPQECECLRPAPASVR